MINVLTKRCRHPNCEKKATFGEPGKLGGKYAEFCAGHAEDGMADVNHVKRCAYPTCTKQPSFGAPGTKKAEFCAPHKPWMVDVCNRMCPHPGCGRQASYGAPDTRKVEFCSKHAKKGMIEVHAKRCRHLECRKCPSYGVSGTKKRDFCALHAEKGMIVIPPRTGLCLDPGCSKVASYGVAGSKKRELCAQHAKEKYGVVNLSAYLKNRKRDGIPTLAEPPKGEAGVGCRVKSEPHYQAQDLVTGPGEACSERGEVDKAAADSAVQPFMGFRGWRRELAGGADGLADLTV
eukprot:g12851.t1